jgi:hypothetical protein
MANQARSSSTHYHAIESAGPWRKSYREGRGEGREGEGGGGQEGDLGGAPRGQTGLFCRLLAVVGTWGDQPPRGGVGGGPRGTWQSGDAALQCGGEFYAPSSGFRHFAPHRARPSSPLVPRSRAAGCSLRWSGPDRAQSARIWGSALLIRQHSVYIAGPGSTREPCCAFAFAFAVRAGTFSSYAPLVSSCASLAGRRLDRRRWLSASTPTRLSGDGPAQRRRSQSTAWPPAAQCSNQHTT